MRDSYAGDLSDLVKFAFLRALASDDRTLGVVWYYTTGAPGSPNDGRHREYRDEPKWQRLDQAVWEELKDLPEYSVRFLEQLSFWPRGTTFYRTPVPSSGGREAWVNEMVTAMQAARIVFLDPDNGVGDLGPKHATVKEVEALRRPGRTTVLIKFPGRQNHSEQIQDHHKLLRDNTGARSVLTLQTCVSVRVDETAALVPRVRWFTLVNAESLLIERARRFATKLNQIEGCSAGLFETVEAQMKSPEGAAALPLPAHSAKLANVCPECGHQFKGNGFDGIDADWRAKHESVMPYREAWPLIKSGTYRRLR